MKILYVEDELPHVELTRRTLEDNLRHEFELIHADTMKDALDRFAAEPDIDIILSDLRLPDGSGLDLLKRVRERQSPPAVVLVTGQGDQEVAVEALKAGAADYLVKQSDYLHRLPVVIGNAVAQNRLAREQAALREAEIKYQALVEQIPAVVFLDKADESEDTFYMSPRIQELTGYTAEEWYADPEIWFTSIHPDDLGKMREAFRKSHEKGTSFREEYRLVRRDGRVIWIKEDTNLIHDKDGNPLYWQGILLDITKEKETQTAIQESEERFRRIFHASPIATCVVGLEDGRFLDANQAFLQLIEGSLENLLGHTSAELGYWDGERDRETFVRDLKQRQSLQGVEVQFANVPGGPKDTLAYYELIDLGGQPCILAMFYEVTEQKKTQRAMQRQLNELAVLQAATAAGTEGYSEDAIIEKITSTIARIYPEICGILLLDSAGENLIPHPSYLGADISRWRAGYPITEGIAGKAALLGKIIRIGDVSNEPGYMKVAPGIKSELCVPIRVHERIIGVINVESRQADAYGENDEKLLTTIADGLGTALERIRLFKTQETQLQREAALLNLMRAAASSLDLKEVLQAILDQLVMLIPSDAGTIQLLDQDRLNIVATIGEEGKFFAAVGRIPLDKFPLNRFVITEKRPLHIDDVRLDERFIRVVETSRTKSLLVVPLIVKGKSIGLITLDSRQTARFTEQHEELALAIANHAAIAIENARLYQEALQAAERRAALHRVSQEIVRFNQDLEQIYAAIHEAAGKLMPCDVFLISLQDEAKDENTLVYAVEAGQRYARKSVPGNQGLTGAIIHDGRSLILRDNEEIEKREFARFGSPKHIQSVVAVPMRIAGKVMGMISAQCYLPYAYGTEEQALLEMLSTHASTAIENARLFQEETRRAKIIETLANIANEIATTREIIPILDKITQSALELLQANHVAIYLIHDDNRAINVISAQGAHREALLSLSLKIGEGITGSVIASGRPEIINDIDGDRRGRRVPGAPELDSQVESMMSSPLMLRGRAIGAINAWRLRSDGMFQQAELNFLINIGHQVSIAIESANLFQEATRRAQEASAIAEVGRDISATLQLDAVLERIATYAKDLLGAETSAVYLFEARAQTLRAVAAVGLDADEVKSDLIEIGSGIIGNIARQKFGEIVNDTLNDPRAVTVKGTGSVPNEHIMGAPVLSKDQLTGLLVVWRSGEANEFKLTELHFLSALGHQAAVAIENARLYDETQRRLHEQETINRVSTALRNTQYPHEMVNILLDETLATLDIRNGSVWIYDPGAGELIQRSARGLPTQFKYTRLKPSEGIVGHVFSTGNAHISPEFLSDPLLYQGNLDNTPPGLGGICIPIQSSGGTIGALLIEVEKGRRINDRIGLLTALAEITGNAIHRAELFEQSQDQILKLTTLRDIDSAIASSTDLRVTLDILMDHTLKHLKTDAVAILLYHSELQTLTYLCSAGFRHPSPSRPLSRLGDGLAGRAVMKGGVEHIPDLRNSGETRRDPLLASEGFVAYFGLPLIVKGQVKGVFEVFHRAPFSPTEDWMHFLHTLAGQAAIAIDNAQLFDHLQRSNQEITQAYDTTLEGWARALELRDRETEGHTRRVTDLTMQLARRMGIEEDELVKMYRGVLLHDIGKMGVPDHILRKEGPLDELEWIEMRKHPEYAFNLLAPIPYLRPALDIPYCHHEHWDGGGYPRGLKGAEIPLAARIFSIVDIWDALLSDRPYRKAWEKDKVIEHLKEISGEILDPKIVTEFLKMIGEEK